MAKKNQKKSHFGKTITTFPGIVIFSRIDRPTAFEEGQEEKFSASLIVKPSPRLNEIEEEINVIGRKAFKDWDAPTKPKQLPYYRPIIKGEEILETISEKKKEKDEEVSDNTKKLYTGTFRILAKGSAKKDPPKCYTIVDGKPHLMQRRPGSESDLDAIKAQFYDGAWVRFSVMPYSYEVGASRGVALVLKGVQFIKDGERIGATDLEAAFSEDYGDFDFGDEVESGFTEEAEETKEANL